MKMSLKPQSFITLIFTSFLALATLSACSEDEQNKSAKGENIYFDHPHGAETSDLKKHSFEHKFADMCIRRELKNSVNKEDDKKRFAKPCLCIAKRVMKNLTAVEAEKFLVEKKSTQSLKMSFDEAAYFCLQSKAKTKAKVIFGKK